jgi:glycosyltransferase involved in cell wall biosynthesis
MARVAVVYHFFPHYRAPVMTDLVERGRHDYLLVADREFYRSSIKSWKIPEHYPWGCPKIFVQRGLLRLALRRDVDSIIYLGNSFYPSTWISAAVAKVTGKRVLFWTIGWMGDEVGVKRWIRKTFYRLADGLLLYGHDAKMKCLQDGLSPEVLHVIYNSLDYEHQRSIRETFRRPADTRDIRLRLFGNTDPMVICTTRLTAHRRLDLLLESLAVLRKRGARVNLLLVGDGNLRASLEETAAKLEVPVHFYGAEYKEEVLGPLVMASNALVAPGMVGLAAMHALAYGTPVITHSDPEDQAPEYEAIQPGITGTLFERNNVESLAAAIASWTQTEDISEAARRNCFGVMERFYNPAFQRRAIERAVDGQPADDLFWMREPQTGSVQS